MLTCDYVIYCNTFDYKKDNSVYVVQYGYKHTYCKNVLYSDILNDTTKPGDSNCSTMFWLGYDALYDTDTIATDTIVVDIVQ